MMVMKLLPLKKCPTTPVKPWQFLGTVIGSIVMSIFIFLYKYRYHGNFHAFLEYSPSSGTHALSRERILSSDPDLRARPHFITISETGRKSDIIYPSHSKHVLKGEDGSPKSEANDKVWRHSPFLEKSTSQALDVGNRPVEALTVRSNKSVHENSSSQPSKNLSDFYPEQMENLSDPKHIKTFSMLTPCKGGHPGCFHRYQISFQGCQYSNCKYVTDFNSADVLGFYAFRIKSESALPELIQQRRPPDQRWVMISPEAPTRVNEFQMLDFPQLKGQFNWTLTYRLDSDIPHLYGKLRAIPPLRKNYRQILASKNLTAAWFVSHCPTPSKRDRYVKRMQTVAKDIHIFGRCGTRNCSDGITKRGLDQDVCFPMLSKSYFFYLAFENSLCVDYVTEKFFKIFKDVDVIPVVRGGIDYKRYFPPDTFVDASDFDSPENLARYLVDLAQNKTRYTYMLQEKNKYRYQSVTKWYCDLCKKIHTDQNVTWYPDMRSWFVYGKCYHPNDL